MVYGIFAGGGSTYTNAIEFITISSSGNSIDFGDLTQAKQSLEEQQILQEVYLQVDTLLRHP